MSEQEIRKNKIGARYLSDFEAELILPTYQRIYRQIEQFRAEKQTRNQSGMQTANSQDKDQKTNNIGILGVRGAGKTSVLKTIQAQLEKKKCENDIILPLIIPENMSESGTLMATVLGMLSDVIKKREEDEKQKRKRNNADCICKISLRQKCDEVIKQYTFIQKEYRDILIQQYTTENDYVKRSTTVFNSDTEFINKFNELIDALVNVQEQDRSLLFLFIDDIDLSTYRCADIVKTLLSYLSNENIVTFISGDLETFEEALTLDFLRRENALSKGILEQKIGDKTLLASKKRLAYEYLKKIIPPAYRYNIKHWSLEEKGNYCMAISTENQTDNENTLEQSSVLDQTMSITLSDLLSQALDGWVDPAFFRYAEIENDADDGNQLESGTDKEKAHYTCDALPYTYHLFDNTSRGLNNIYNVLKEIVAERNEKKDAQATDYSKEKKLLLDTIISSKPTYNKYRTDIQQNFFRVATQADSKVYFDNARAIIYRKKQKEIETGANLGENQNTYHIADPTERFSLFILVDFAARLLYESNYEKKTTEDAFYSLLKEESMKDFFFNPIIAEKVMDGGNYSWETKEETEQRTAALARGDKIYPQLKDMQLKDVNRSFLLKGDLVLNLAYYRNLPLDAMLKLYEDTNTSDNINKRSSTTAELEQNTIIAIWKALASTAKVNGARESSEIIAKYYAVFWVEFAYIRNKLSSSVTQNIALRLFDSELNAAVGYNKKNTAPLDWETQREMAQMKRILSNTLACLLRAQNKDIIKEDWQEIDWENLYIVEKDTAERKIAGNEQADIEARMNILKAIDSKTLWQAEAAEAAIKYLKSEIRKYLKFIKNSLENMEADEWSVNTKDANEAWELFERAYVGVSDTIARRTRNKVKTILADDETDFSQGMSLSTYRSVIEKLEKLAGNNLVWYGQSEAQQILNDLQKAFAIPDTQDAVWNIWMKKYSYFVFLLQCLYKYKTTLVQKDNIIQDALLLANITQKLSVAHKEADKRTLDEFISELNSALSGPEINAEQFEQLFPYTTNR